MQTNERRREGRFLCAELIRLEWRGGGNALRSVEAVLEDISPLGTCVQVEEEIFPGVAITLSMGNRKYSGDVTYCVYRDYGYFVGIRLAKDSEWSSGSFAPQHLTDLLALGDPLITDPAGT